ncbi:MAG TPA: response regulator transcription factor [Sphingomicrobium sp.]|nr:response regulator transcription factor [Sphingomicrobium sp.]
MARGNHVAVIADESALCCAGLIHILNGCLSFSKVLTCRNFRELAGLLGEYRSRVGLAVVQFDLPGMKRINGLRRICETWPSVPILVTGDCCDRDTILDVLSAGSHGFIPKSSSPAELEQALRATAGGQVFVSPMSVTRSAPEPAESKGFHEAELTARQKEVLTLLAAGKSNKQIAWALGISEGTVKVHVNAAFRALGVHNRVNATTALLGLTDLASVGS